MKSLWDDAEAARFGGPLGPRVYTSRLLGREPSLVLHGGGNTSVKLAERDLFGEEEKLLYVKGSGWDLATIEPEGFAPVVLERARRLASLPALSDAQMVSELAAAVRRSGAPAPSVETLLHAILPYAYVDHTHADAILSLSNSPEGERRIRELYGERVVVVPYVMAGFDLATYCAREFPRQVTAHTEGMVLLSHGIFTFGATARESYERMIALVSLAEEYLAAHRAWQIALPEPPPATVAPLDIADLRKSISDCAGAPMLLCLNDAPRYRAFATHPEAARLTLGGPATPDHVIRTKPWPALGRDVVAYAERYRAYYARHAPHAREPKTMLDPAPRVVLDPALGLVAAGRSAREAIITRELYEHTVEVVLRAEALGGWRPLAEQHLFDIEYWELEQAKLRKAGTPPMFAGEVALVTGAASGIGRACVEAFLRRGAAVVALDRDPTVETCAQRTEVLARTCDVTERAALEAGVTEAIRAFGGIDMLVLNAGIFPASEELAHASDAAWEQAFRVNAQANLALLRILHPFLCRAPRGGRVVVIGSRNVPAPGFGAAVYSASKAALTQIARVAALEWAKDGIRVNVLHPDAVYDTGLWTPQLLEARARAYGLSVEAYKRRNLLGVEVRARDVAELAAELCGPLFAKTTGAQIPVDGGSDRVV